RAGGEGGVRRIEPGRRVSAPADAQQARSALLATWDAEGPTYYRLGKDERSAVRGLDGAFEPDRVQWVRHGGDLLLIGMGSAALEAGGAAGAPGAAGAGGGGGGGGRANPPPPH